MNTIELLRAAKVTQADVARLLRVSRVSVNSWITGRTAPGKFHEPRFNAVITGIKRALDAGLLPGYLETLARSALDPDERFTYVRQQLKIVDTGPAQGDAALDE